MNKVFSKILHRIYIFTAKYEDRDHLSEKSYNKVYNSTVSLKRKYWPKFNELIKKQFEHGGNKYALNDNMEFTDLVCMLSPGETGADWILQTMCKYICRYKNFKREKDLLKIATYAFIMWIKMGYHLKNEHDEDININGK